MPKRMFNLRDNLVDDSTASQSSVWLGQFLGVAPPPAGAGSAQAPPRSRRNHPTLNLPMRPHPSQPPTPCGSCCRAIRRRNPNLPAGLHVGVPAVLILLGCLSGLPNLIPARAAADAPIQQRLREAVRLPAQELRVEWGFVGAQDWLGEVPVADPPAELERLRARLKGEPSDAPTLREIARVTTLLGDSEAAAAAHGEAFEAWQRWAAAAPGNRDTQLGYARALRETGRFEEAGRLLRRLLAEADSFWEARYELATTLGEQAMADLLTNPGLGPGSPRPDPARLDRAGGLLAEAMRLADELVASAPENPRGWARRARLRTNGALLAFAQAGRAEGRAESRRWMGALLPADALPDLEAALQLRPDDPRLLFARLMHRLGPVVLDLMEEAYSRRGSGALDALDAATQDAFVETAHQLERIAGRSDRALAAAALYHAAFTRFLGRGGLDAAGPLAARALELNPHHTEALQMALTAVLAAENPDWTRAEDFVRMRLKARPNDAFTRLTLVKLLEKQDRKSDALQEVHAALETLDKDAALQLAHVALHIRFGDWPAPDDQELRHLKATRERIVALPDSQEKADLAADFMVTVAVLKALSGEVPSARRDLDSIVEQRPDHEYAREVRDLVWQMPGR